MAPGSAYWNRNDPQHEAVKARVTAMYQQEHGGAPADPNAPAIPPNELAGPVADASPLDGAPVAPLPPARLEDLPALAPGQEWDSTAPALYSDARQILADMGSTDANGEAAHWFREYGRLAAEGEVSPESLEQRQAEAMAYLRRKHGARAPEVARATEAAYAKIPARLRDEMERVGFELTPAFLDRLAQHGAPIDRAETRLAAIHRNPAYLDKRAPNHAALVAESFRLQQVVHGRR
jgi:hypothetical protein